MTLTEKIQYHYEELLKLAARDAPELLDLEHIVRDKLAELVNRTRSGPSAFNNYMAAKHSQLPQDQQSLGQNTRAIAESWRQEDVVEKLKWRNEHLQLVSAEKRQEQQMKTAVRHLKYKFFELQRLGFDVLILVCDKRCKIDRPYSLSTTFVTMPNADTFLRAMSRLGVGQEQFSRYCKGHAINAMIQRKTQPANPAQPLNATSACALPSADLNRNDRRSRLTERLLQEFNKHKPDHQKLSRLPVQPWDDKLQRMGLVFSLPQNVTIWDIYDALGRKKGSSDRLQMVLSSVENGGIFLTREVSASPCPE